METGRLSTLVTGATGFLGSHLLAHLNERGCEKVIPSARRNAGSIVGCNLCDAVEVRSLLAQTRPSRIFHCAGSFSNEFEQDFKSNVLTTQHLLQAVLELGLSCRILLIGSAAEYGIPDSEGGFIAEDHPLRPVSIYGYSKACQTELMDYFRRTRDMDIVMARVFNLDGKGLSGALFAGRVRAQIEGYLEKRIRKIEVGDLSAYRDYLPVVDAISDLMTVMNHGEAGEVYNLGSGFPVQMKAFLQGLLEQHDISLNAVSTDAALEIRSSRVPVIAANVTKINSLKARV